MEISLKLDVSQVNRAFPLGLRGDGKTDREESFMFDPVSDPVLLDPKQILLNLAKVHKLKAKICLYLNTFSVK